MSGPKFPPRFRLMWLNKTLKRKGKDLYSSIHTGAKRQGAISQLYSFCIICIRSDTMTNHEKSRSLPFSTLHRLPLRLRVLSVVPPPRGGASFTCAAFSL